MGGSGLFFLKNGWEHVAYVKNGWEWVVFLEKWVRLAGRRCEWLGVGDSG